MAISIKNYYGNHKLFLIFIFKKGEIWMSKKVETLYKNAMIKMQEGNWKEGRRMALECVKKDPDFLGGWKLMFMYQIRKSTLTDETIKENLKIKDIPFNIIEQSITEEKIRKFKNSFLKCLKKKLNQ